MNPPEYPQLMEKLELIGIQYKKFNPLSYLMKRYLISFFIVLYILYNYRDSRIVLIGTLISLPVLTLYWLISMQAHRLSNHPMYVIKGADRDQLEQMEQEAADAEVIAENLFMDHFVVYRLYTKAYAYPYEDIVKLYVHNDPTMTYGNWSNGRSRIIALDKSGIRTTVVSTKDVTIPMEDLMMPLVKRMAANGFHPEYTLDDLTPSPAKTVRPTAAEEQAAGPSAEESMITEPEEIRPLLSAAVSWVCPSCRARCAGDDLICPYCLELRPLPPSGKPVKAVRPAKSKPVKRRTAPAGSYAEKTGRLTKRGHAVVAAVTAAALILWAIFMVYGVMQIEQDEAAGHIVGDPHVPQHAYYFDYTVNDWEYTKSYETLSAPQNRQLLVVNLTMKNTFPEQISMYDADFYVTYSDTWTYPVTVNDPDAVCGNMLEGTYTLKPNQIITGDLVFEVSSPLKISWLYHEIILDSGEEKGSIRIRLGNDYPYH